MKRAIILMALATFAVKTVAETQFNWFLGTNGFVVDGYRGDRPVDLVIPETATFFGETGEVLTIGEAAFRDCDTLKTVKGATITAVGIEAFAYCEALETVWLPKATTIGDGSFKDCIALKFLTVSEELRLEIEANRSIFGLGENVKVDSYQPSEPEFVTVSKEAISAAKADLLRIENGSVVLGVSVMSNGNLSIPTATWGKIELKSEDVTVKDGRIEITISAKDKSGFMILQTTDATVEVVK